MSLDPSKPLRTGTSKTRTGCLTCLQRRIKCDETKPTCRQCLKSKRPCHLRSTPIPTATRIVCYTPLPPALSTTPDASTAELRAVEYFRLITAPALAGVHATELWTQQILAVAAAERAVWWAVVAVGAGHEVFSSPSAENGGGRGRPFALQAYSRAVSTLAAAISTNAESMRRETALLAAVLFCAFEIMSSHFRSALGHVSGGLRVLVDFKGRMRGVGSGQDMWCGTLFPLFTRLDSQRMELGDEDFPTPRALEETLRKVARVPGDVVMLQHEFDGWMNGLLGKAGACGILFARYKRYGHARQQGSKPLVETVRRRSIV